MTDRIPLTINAEGDPQRMQSGDRVGVAYGGVGQKLRGVIGQTSGNTTIPFDTTQPTIAEGTQIFSQSITPTVIGANIRINIKGLVVCSSSNAAVTIAVFRNSTFIGFATVASSGGNGASPSSISVDVADPVTSLTPVTYSARIGSSSGTWYFGRGITQTMGGTGGSYWEMIEEM